MKHFDDATLLVRAERERQVQKWGGYERIVPDLTKFAVLGEEMGEVAKALLEEKPADLKAELVQAAAVAMAWLEQIILLENLRFFVLDDTEIYAALDEQSLLEELNNGLLRHRTEDDLDELDPNTPWLDGMSPKECFVRLFAQKNVVLELPALISSRYSEQERED